MSNEHSPHNDTWWFSEWTVDGLDSPALDSRQLMEYFIRTVESGEVPAHGILQIFAQRFRLFLEDEVARSLDQVFGIAAGERGRPGEPVARQQSVVRRVLEVLPAHTSTRSAIRAVAPDLDEKTVRNWIEKHRSIVERAMEVQRIALELLEADQGLTLQEAWQKAKVELERELGPGRELLRRESNQESTRES